MNECVYRGVQGGIITVVAKLQGGEKDTRKMKLKWRASQTLRANQIADELNGYVKTLSWHLHNLMVRCGILTN